MGITTICLVAAAVCLAVLRRRVRVLKAATILRIHRAVGVATLVARTIHAALVLSR